MPIRDLLGTDDGDLAIVNGDFAPVTDLAAVKQGIRIRTQLLLGECWLDESVGVDYLGQILVKNPDPLVVRGLIEAAILDTPDVLGVVSSQVAVDSSARTGTLTASVATAYGQLTVASALNVGTR